MPNSMDSATPSAEAPGGVEEEWTIVGGWRDVLRQRVEPGGVSLAGHQRRGDGIERHVGPEQDLETLRQHAALTVC
jgi:hypothetical protein